MAVSGVRLSSGLPRHVTATDNYKIITDRLLSILQILKSNVDPCLVLIVLWCNSSTGGSNPFGLGANPGGTTKMNLFFNISLSNTRVDSREQTNNLLAIGERL